MAPGITSRATLRLLVVTCWATLIFAQAPVEDQSKAAAGLVELSQNETLKLSSWKSLLALTFESGFAPALDIALEVEQRVRARKGGEADGFDVFTSWRQTQDTDGVPLELTVEVTNMGVKTGDTDKFWVRFGTVVADSFAANPGLPRGVWVRLGSLDSEFKDFVERVALLNDEPGHAFHDAAAFVTAEELAREVLDGVDVRVVSATGPALPGFFPPGLAPTDLQETLSMLSTSIGNATIWIQQADDLFVKSEGAFAKGTLDLNVSRQFFDYNVTVDVPDPTTGLFGAFDGS